MPLIMLALSLILGLLVLDAIAYLPINLLGLFQPSKWLILSVVSLSLRGALVNEAA